MNWLGYTTQHLFGNIAILLLILLFWWLNKMETRLNPTWREIIIIIIIILVFVLTVFYTIYLRENPSEIQLLF